MAITIYNTMTRQKEPFETLEEGVVRLYVCGPTVYDKAHIGHAMSSLVFDVIRRYLVYKGYQVRHVMNYTDVDDKIINRANELGMEPVELSESYINAYGKHLAALNILPATVFPRVSEEIGSIVAMIQGLIDKGHAYPVDGDVYFDVQSDEDYGRLSRRKLDDMQAGARIDIDERKHHPSDFALWKAAKPDEPAWESPWGPGRPGWHIECSAMSLQYLGDQIDIHGGGNDLVFPHHENEIAQSESLTGQWFARYWVHNGMLTLDEKMSKSLGNVITIEEFLSDHEADVLRMLVLNFHYRSPLEYSDEVITQAQKALDRLRSGLRPAYDDQAAVDQHIVDEFREQISQAQSGFEARMDDDFNAAGALSHLFDLVRAINKARDAGVGDDVLQEGQDVLIELSQVLGLTLDQGAVSQPAVADPFIDLLLEIRNELRHIKQWELADRIRDDLDTLGIEVEDTRDGSAWRYKAGR